MSLFCLWTYIADSTVVVYQKIKKTLNGKAHKLKIKVNETILLKWKPLSLLSGLKPLSPYLALPRLLKMIWFVLFSNFAIRLPQLALSFFKVIYLCNYNVLWCTQWYNNQIMSCWLCEHVFTPALCLYKCIMQIKCY